MHKRYIAFKFFEAVISGMVFLSIISVVVFGVFSFAKGRTSPAKIDSNPPSFLYPTAQPITDRLTVSGRTVINERGTRIRLMGVNYNELSSDYQTLDKCTNHPNLRLDTSAVKNWGFNSVRLTIRWSSLEPEKPTWENGVLVHHWDMNYLKLVDDQITDITSKNLGVILDMHQYLWSSRFKNINSEDGNDCANGGGDGFPQWLYENSTITDFQQARCQFFEGRTPDGSLIDPQTGFIEAWKLVANRYAKNPKVIAADIINEPWSAVDKCTPADLHLNSFFQKVGSAIRDVNPEIILIFEDSQDFGDGNFALTGPLFFSNTMYSFHLYTRKWQPDGEDRLKRFLKRANEWNVPLFVGEFNAFDYGNDANASLTWKRDLEKLLTFFKEKDIHWAYWAYSGKESLINYTDNKPKAELLDFLRRGL